MIKNRKQYKTVQERAAQVAETLHELEIQKEAMNPRLYSLNRNALESQQEDLQREMNEFDSLKSGALRKTGGSPLADIDKALISYRISLGWTQKELAGKIGVKEQQIQRYEANDYQSASLHRIIEIVDAMGIPLRLAEVMLPRPQISFPDHKKQALEETSKRVREMKSLLPIPKAC